MSKFTSGKWEIADDLGIVVHPLSCRPNIIYICYSCRPIDGITTLQEAERNARLIAAAPEMYSLFEDFARLSPTLTKSPRWIYCAEDIVKDINTDIQPLSSFSSWDWELDDCLCVDSYDADGLLEKSICEVCDDIADNKSDEETRANARLIASVPKMYSIIKKIAALTDQAPEIQNAASRALDIIHSVDGNPPQPEFIEMEDTVPCAQCGSTEQTIFRTREWNGTAWYAIQCSGCENHSADFLSVNEAARDWNRRNNND